MLNVSASVPSTGRALVRPPDPIGGRDRDGYSFARHPRSHKIAPSKPAGNQEYTCATKFDPIDDRLEQISSFGIGQQALPQALCFSQ
jgi:hypothetical protein